MKKQQALLDVYKRQVGDSLIRMQDRGNEAVRDYLQRKSAILDLDFMAVIGMDGTAVSTCLLYTSRCV